MSPPCKLLRSLLQSTVYGTWRDILAAVQTANFASNKAMNCIGVAHSVVKFYRTRQKHDPQKKKNIIRIPEVYTSELDTDRVDPPILPPAVRGLLGAECSTPTQFIALFDAMFAVCTAARISRQVP